MIAVFKAIVIGSVGGAFFFWLGMPLAWMIGSMVAATIAAMLGISLRIPPWLRILNIGIIGVMLGSSFSPDLISHFIQWWPSYLGLLISIIITAYACYFLLSNVMRLDPVTAFYSSMPGGLSEMVLGGGEKGGNTAAISVIHGTRVLIIVMIIPFGYSFWSGHAIDRAVQLGGSILEFQWDDALILSLCLGFGVLFARWIHLPASNLVGPMLMSGVVHLAGFTDARPPNEIVAIAQIIVGTAIGARFSGIKTADVVRYMGYSIGSTLLMVFVATIMASLIFFIGVGESYFNILLGLVPGGLAEMSLIALSLNLEVAFVSSHHIVRIFLVVLLAPLLLSFVRPQDGSRNNETTK